jgi:hypothetical protein
MNQRKTLTWCSVRAEPKGRREEERNAVQVSNQSVREQYSNAAIPPHFELPVALRYFRHGDHMLENPHPSLLAA